MFILSTLDLRDVLYEIQLKRAQLWLPNHRVAEPLSYPLFHNVVCLFRSISTPLSTSFLVLKRVRTQVFCSDPYMCGSYQEIYCVMLKPIVCVLIR